MEHYQCLGEGLLSGGSSLLLWETHHTVVCAELLVCFIVGDMLT